MGEMFFGSSSPTPKMKTRLLAEIQPKISLMLLVAATLPLQKNGRA